MYTLRYLFLYFRHLIHKHNEICSTDITKRKYLLTIPYEITLEQVNCIKFLKFFYLLLLLNTTILHIHSIMMLEFDMFKYVEFSCISMLKIIFHVLLNIMLHTKKNSNKNTYTLILKGYGAKHISKIGTISSDNLLNNWDIHV